MIWRGLILSNILIDRQWGLFIFIIIRDHNMLWEAGFVNQLICNKRKGNVAWVNYLLLKQERLSDCFISNFILINHLLLRFMCLIQCWVAILRRRGSNIIFLIIDNIVIGVVVM